MDENLHHEDDEMTQEVAEKMIQNMMDDWSSHRSKLWKVWSWFYGHILPGRHVSKLYVYDNGEATGLRLRCVVNNHTQIQSKMVALTAHWLLQQFVVKLGQKDPDTLKLVGKMMFLGKFKHV